MNIFNVTKMKNLIPTLLIFFLLINQTLNKRRYHLKPIRKNRMKTSNSRWERPCVGSKALSPAYRKFLSGYVINNQKFRVSLKPTFQSISGMSLKLAKRVKNAKILYVSIVCCVWDELDDFIHVSW